MARLQGAGNFGRLSGQQKNDFRTALLDAFDTRARLKELVALYLSRNWDQITEQGTLKYEVLTVIETADTENWTADLLRAAREAAPTNAALIEFAEQFRLSPLMKPARELEREIRKTIKEWDVLPFLRGLGQAEPCVCRVEVSSSGKVEFGTGFLLGSDIVMTNYHVVENVINGATNSAKVVLRFDYKMLQDQETLNAGTVYHLVKDDWLIDSSKYSPLDKLADPGNQVPSEDELDYALLRVDGKPGQEPVNGAKNVDPNAEPRGWIAMGAAEPRFEPDTILSILQHPRAQPLKLVLDTNSIIGLNSNATRVWYRTNTDHGSSGSPCFDGNWNWIALHHGGDPDYAEFHKPTYNQGIPIQAIRKRLGSKLDLLGR